MNVLVACEESQAVCTAFRERGHNAFSCDIQECSGGHPEWHIRGDVLPLLNGNCKTVTVGGAEVEIKGNWDLVIAHPPCTYLTVSGNAWFDINKYGDKARQRYKDRYQAIVFFMQMVLAAAPRVAVENPIGIMNTAYRRADQIIQPYEYGHPESKKTCLWLKGLPLLKPTNILKLPKNGVWDNQTKDRQNRLIVDGKWIAFNDPRTAKERSKTYPGIAKAMADQWGSEPVETQISLF